MPGYSKWNQQRRIAEEERKKDVIAHARNTGNRKSSARRTRNCGLTSQKEKEQPESNQGKGVHSGEENSTTRGIRGEGKEKTEDTKRQTLGGHNGAERIVDTYK